MLGFERRRDSNDYMFNKTLVGLQGELDAHQSARLRKIRQEWNFYEGYHWEDMPEQDTPEITVNYCRAFVDKFVSFELGKSFTTSYHKDMENVSITTDGLTISKYLENVWDSNQKIELLTEIGQMKSITGESWVQVRYFDSEELSDPFNEYPEGRVQLVLLPTAVVFPEFDPHQKGVLIKLTVMYMYEKLVRTPILGGTKKEQTLYKQIWTDDEVAIKDGREPQEVYPNKYGTIPFAQIKNLVVAGRNEGRGDLEDLIPLNTELNMKKSNVSEIIDYHSAPVTIVYGAKIGNLEKGANKMWGGLAKDARIENLELRSDLASSTNYIHSLKTEMCEVGGIPETVLGGSQSISNTSGVALQYINLPLIEKTRLKRSCTESGIERLNKLILLISLLEGLITKPNNVTTKDFFWNKVKLPDTLPKDMLLEVQLLQQELLLGLESRENAFKRLNKDNVEELKKDIEKDIEEYPQYYTQSSATNTVNSGIGNGDNAVDTVRKEMTGANGSNPEVN